MVRRTLQRYRHTGYKTFYFGSAVIVSFCRDDVVLQALVFKTFISGPGDAVG